MFFVSVKRVIRSGVIGFFRNAFVSFATMLIMMITLFVIGASLFMNAALESTLEQIKNKVDINAYFLPGVSEDKVLEVKSALEQLPEVESITYTSKEDVLKQFKEEHKGDQLTIQALEELDENPFGASLAIRAKDPSQYERIAKFLEEHESAKSGENRILEKVNYNQNKLVIDRLNRFMNAIDTFVLFVSSFLVIASIMIVFNTIRLAIYTNKDEIEVMQLVGASNWFVRGPYVIEGILYGFVSGLIVLFAFYPLAAYFGTVSEQFFGSFNTLTFYINEFGTLFLYIVGSGVLLGAISSFLAVRRYLGI